MKQPFLLFIFVYISNTHCDSPDFCVADLSHCIAAVTVICLVQNPAQNESRSEHPHCCLQADPRTGVSVYLYKALLAIAAHLLLQGYHNLGLYLLLLLATKCPIVAN